MSKIKSQFFVLLNRYLDLVLYKFRPIYNKKTGFQVTSLTHNTPVPFRYRSTNTPYGFNLFHLGLIDRPHRRGSRKVLIRTVNDNNVKIISVCNEDIMSLTWSAQNLNGSDHELLSLGIKLSNYNFSLSKNQKLEKVIYMIIKR